MKLNGKSKITLTSIGSILATIIAYQAVDWSFLPASGRVLDDHIAEQQQAEAVHIAQEEMKDKAQDLHILKLEELMLNDKLFRAKREGNDALVVTLEALLKENLGKQEKLK